MKIRRTQTFVRQYKKLAKKIRVQFGDRLQLWLIDPTHPQLRVHPLKGDFRGYWSMSITGDIRVLYYYEDDDVVVFALIGTHSQLYG